MVAATRMPEAYDGFLVGDPGFDLPRAAIQHAWDAQAFVKADPDIRKSITADDAALVSRKIIAACDKLDGLEDGLTENLAACQKAFDFDSLICAPGASADCLPKAKVEALKMSFAGPRNSKGEALYSDWPVDGGVGTGNWRLWKIESPIPPWDHYPIIATMGAASLDYIFTTPPTPVAGSTDALMKSLLAFDFDRDAPKIYATTDAFPQSAMEFMTPPDVDDPKLAQFRQLGRKMIIYHGQADPVFSIDDTIRWYEKLNANLDGKADVDVRLFAVPGHDSLQRRPRARQVRCSDRAGRLGRERQGAGPDHRHCRSGEQGDTGLLEPEPHPPALPLAEIRANTQAAIRRARRRSNARSRDVHSGCRRP